MRICGKFTLCNPTYLLLLLEVSPRGHESTYEQTGMDTDRHTEKKKETRQEKTRQDKTRRDRQRGLNMQTDKPTQTCTQTETSTQTFSQAGAQTKL